MSRYRILLPALVAITASSLALWAGASAFAEPSAMRHGSSAAPPIATRITQKQITFRNALGKYWEDHITWTRLFVISALTESPDLPAVTQRLLQNQVDIGNAIKPFYGEAAGDQMTALLRDHILIAADVLTAAKAGRSDALNQNMMRWQANADQIGDFLGTANPDNWSADEMRAMMREHLDLTTTEVIARLNNDWAGDIAAYDKVHLHILMLADVLTNGIVAQFPAAFEEPAQATVDGAE
jgi:hypothetical protein